jgi:thiol:disulfide interchange protein DsbD
MLLPFSPPFLGGLILNCMPCVFPIISLKAFGLVRQGRTGSSAP